MNSDVRTNAVRIALPLLFLLSCGIRVSAESEHRAEFSREQTSFGAEDDFRKPIPLPVDALRSLRISSGASDLQECANSEGISVAEIPPSWFVASQIRLRRTGSYGLVVRGTIRCLYGAHIASFWVLEKSTDGCRVVFQGKADALSFLPTYTNDYRDLQLGLISEAGASVDHVNLRYLTGRYQVSGQCVGHPNQPKKQLKKKSAEPLL
jgi:hypothetical protein